MYVRLSAAAAINMKISVDNLFVEEYMPHAPDNFVKVYLFGLSLVSHNIAGDNSLERIAKRLSLDSIEIEKAFTYWANQGLVNISKTAPISIEYLPVREASNHYTRKFSKDKYADFNKQLYAVLPQRQVLQQEFYEYYSFMESTHMTPEAMLSVISYCARLKGYDIGHRYILTVAHNLSREGLLTFDQVNQNLDEINLYKADLLDIFKALKIKRSPDHDDVALYKKWTRQMGFAKEVCKVVAKKIKKGGMDALDTRLSKYCTGNRLSLKEIDDYDTQYEFMTALAKDINRIIGLYYENVGHIVDVYISNWLALGLDSYSIKLIAEYNFKSGKRTLDMLNDTVHKFYKQGLLNTAAIHTFVQQAIDVDNKIKLILDMLNENRGISSRDREFFRTWTSVWKMNDAIIECATFVAKQRPYPMTALNTILADYHNKNINTVDKATNYNSTLDNKHTLSLRSASPAAIQNNTPHISMTAQQLNALFDGLDANDIF